MMSDVSAESRKRKSDRAGPRTVPTHIRVFGTRLTEERRTRIRQNLGKKLGKFAASIERVSVRVKDVNGPRGGIDQLCRIKVVLRNLPSVVFEKVDPSLDAAIEGALDGTGRLVQRGDELSQTTQIHVVFTQAQFELL
jgi:hypothetical protein